MQKQFDASGQEPHDCSVPVTREFIRRLCGKYRGKNLLKALMAEKKREKDFEMKEQKIDFTDILDESIRGLDAGHAARYNRDKNSSDEAHTIIR
jgi:hypothetical protein